MNYKETATYIKYKDMPQNNFPENIFIHHTGGENGVDTSKQTAKIVEDYHLSLGWDGLGYQFFIDYEGVIWRGRPEHRNGAHVKEKGMNTKSIGICLAGNFDVTMPTEKQIISLKKLMKEMSIKYNIPASKVLPHRSYALGANGKPYKSCYGSKLADNWASNLLLEELSQEPKKRSKDEIKAEIINLLQQL